MIFSMFSLNKIYKILTIIQRKIFFLMTDGLQSKYSTFFLETISKINLKHAY